MAKLYAGSVLNGGGVQPFGKTWASVDDWLELADAFWEASMDTSDGGLAIPIILGTDAVHGHTNVFGATVFPQPIGLGATFDRELIHSIYSAVSDEARAKFAISQEIGNYARYAGLTFWTPNVNIFRDPRWGRGMETYGEDPYRNSQLGMVCIQGLQGNHPKYLKA